MIFDQGTAGYLAPANLQARALHAEQTVADGLANNSREQFILAALQYQSILNDPGFDSADPQASEIYARLGAVHCLIAQTEPPGPKSLDFLARAQTMLGKALDHCKKTVTPLAWARTRANLAIVLMTRYGQTRAAADLFTALMTLEGVSEAFAQGQDFEAEDWVHDIRNRLNDLRGQTR